MLNPKITIYSDFLNKYDKQLLIKICKKREANNIHISQFKRFGFSGAKLLLAYFNKYASGLPFLVKVAQKNDIQSEYQAINSMKNHVRDCSLLASDKCFSSGDWGMLIYHHAGTNTCSNAQTPKSLREVLYCKDTDFSKEDLTKTLKEVYDRLKNAHSCNKCLLISPEDHYKRYFREHKSRDKVINILGKDNKLDSFKFLNEEIYNPLTLLKKLPKKLRIPVGLVHGDLHPDNIIIGNMNNPYLIDFAWAEKKRDVLVDYVLIENSIRFKDFPRGINLEEQRQVDQFLLDEDGWKNIDKCNFATDELLRINTRLASMIGTIRESAKSILGEYFFFEKYLFTQFIVLYGLLRFDEYEQYSATRALGMISKRVKESGLI